MSKDEKKNRSKPKSGALDKFEPGGELGQLDDRNEYEQLLNSLLAEQKELAEEMRALLISASTFPSTRWTSRRPLSKVFERVVEGRLGS